MRIITPVKRRKLYAEEIAPGEFVLSAIQTAKDNYRPMARFNTRQELEQEALQRGCEVVWQ